MNNKQTGILGENFAEEYLKRNHYYILQRNYRKKWGEIDIVVYDKKTKETVFIEVKTLTGDCLNILPEEELTITKIKKLKKAILSFISQHQLEEKPWRFDFLAIEIQKNALKPDIRHYKDIYLEF